MPLIAHNKLPTYDRLLKEGRVLLHPDRAYSQDIRELHIGFLNMMPDAALEATERQFFRLVGESNRIAQFYMHPFTVETFKRGDKAQAHIDKHYEPWEKIKEEGLDALIITGANEETNPTLQDEQFWGPLNEVLEWAKDNVTSTICSCLASHAAVRQIHGEIPNIRDTKRWGVYKHRVLDRTHPLCKGMNTLFDAPHSRYSELSREQFENAGMKILVESDTGDVHVAVSPDGISLICMQGHPEYDIQSLLKEYRREIQNFIDNERDDYPPLPDNYFGKDIQNILNGYYDKVLNRDAPHIDDFPEEDIEILLENTWRDSAKSMIGNWVGIVYQVTSQDRTQKFMQGVDPDNPLDWRANS